LDVDDVIAGLLVTEGFGSLEEIVETDDEELASIEGFDENVAAELKRRAQASLERRDQELDEKRREMGVDDKVGETGGFTPAMMVALGEKGVKTLDDLGDLAADELIEILGEDSVDEETANAIIMAARQRAGWFGEEEQAAAEAAAAEAAQAAAAEADEEALEEGDETPDEVPADEMTGEEPAAADDDKENGDARA
jgi:N utilization substance protein A